VDLRWFRRSMGCATARSGAGGDRDQPAATTGVDAAGDLAPRIAGDELEAVLRAIEVLQPVLDEIPEPPREPARWLAARAWSLR
jgi:hypothetical protein